MKVSNITNLLARSFIVFILAYLWLGFYISGLLLVFALSLLITAAVNYVFYLVSRKKKTKQALTRRQEQHMRAVTLQLKFMPRVKVQTLFAKAAPKPIHSLFHKEVTSADIIQVIKRVRRDGDIIIAAEDFPPAVRAFAATLDRPIRLLNAREVYEHILLPAQVFPEISVQFKPRKRLTWALLREMVFSRAKIRPYITIGIIILLTSFIVKFNVYYIIIATIVFSFALVCLFMPQSKHEYL